MTDVWLVYLDIPYEDAEIVGIASSLPEAQGMAERHSAAGNYPLGAWVEDRFGWFTPSQDVSNDGYHLHRYTLDKGTWDGIITPTGARAKRWSALVE